VHVDWQGSEEFGPNIEPAMPVPEGWPASILGAVDGGRRRDTPMSGNRVMQAFGLR
jgi:hypothetical protein